MEENKTIIINKENLQRLLENYFNQEKLKVRIETKKECNYYMNEECYACNTQIKLKRIINIGGVNIDIIETINEDDIKTIFAELLNVEGYEIITFEMLNTIDNVSTGYGMGERMEQIAVFGGVQLTVREVKRKNLVR